MNTIVLCERLPVMNTCIHGRLWRGDLQRGLATEYTSIVEYHPITHTLVDITKCRFTAQHLLAVITQVIEHDGR
jgi:hypothetical protein